MEVRLRKSIAFKPNSITIKMDRYDKWRMSFSYEDQSGQVSDEKELQIDWLGLLKTKIVKDRNEMTDGLDRGIKIPIATNSCNYDFTDDQKKSMDDQKKSMDRTERCIKKLQRKLARQKKGSKKRAMKFILDSGTELSPNGVLIPKVIKYGGGRKAKIAPVGAITQKKR